jgi:hypothetical protein
MSTKYATWEFVTCVEMNQFAMIGCNDQLTIGVQLGPIL